jgi:hypothetical protein
VFSVWYVLRLDKELRVGVSRLLQVKETGYRSICERSTRNGISRSLRGTRKTQGRARGTPGIVNTTSHVGSNTAVTAYRQQ